MRSSARGARPHGIGEAFKQVKAVLRAGAGFGVVLHRKHRAVGHADTLEWTLPNPPPEHTFEELPTREMWDRQPHH